jgi:enoyl-CoA hydratase
MGMSEPEVLTEVDGNVLVVTINRPDAKNAMNKAAAEGISAAMDRLDAEAGLQVAILTGAGGTFCSGMDLKGFLRGDRRRFPGAGSVAFRSGRRRSRSSRRSMAMRWRAAWNWRCRAI